MVALSPHPGSFQIDATVGGGGHAVRILEAANPDGRLLGLDADPRAIARTRDAAGRRSATASTLRQANFEDIGEVAREAGFEQVDGILIDLGLSSHQLAGESAASASAPTGALDMRFDSTRGVPASELMATLDEDALAIALPPLRRGAARAAHRPRDRARDASTRPDRTAGRAGRPGGSGRAARPRAGRRIHPATRVFQALRIARQPRAGGAADGARGSASTCCGRTAASCVISYHSLEDRIVKRFMAAERRGCICPPELPGLRLRPQSPRLAPVGAQPQVPSDDEVDRNPRARSAQLRAARRLAA